MHSEAMLSLNRNVNKENRSAIFFYILIFFLLAGCAGTPVAPATGEPLLIQTKAIIKDQNESNSVKIEIALFPKKAIRLEITATLGVSVATVLMTPSEITYALHTTKQFATGPFNEKTLFPIFRKNIDPRILWRIINDQPMTNLNLKCAMNTNSKPVKCTAVDGTTFKWTYDEPPFKRIDIISNRFEMNWLFRDQSLLDTSQNETFVLKKPESYQEIIIK